MPGEHGGGRVRFLAGVRLRVRTLLAGVVFFGLVLALVVQNRRHREEEAAWAAEAAERARVSEKINNDLFQVEFEYLAKTRMGFKQVTLAILEAPTRIEKLVVLRHGSVADKEPVKLLTGEDSWVYRTRPAGEITNPQFAKRLAGFLLDTNNYLFHGTPVTVLDAPAEPEFGFRLEKGAGRLDVLFSLENRDREGHADLHLQSWTERGELLERDGRTCMFNPALVQWLTQERPKPP